METLVVVCVHNRTDNIAHWIRCWKICNPPATLVVIQNNPPDGDIRDLCDAAHVRHFPRYLPGFDIGALQDVARRRMPGFPYYDNILWCCDDCFPMSKDFVQQYQALMPKVACMQISPFVRQHIRTTGFMITRGVLEGIRFPADPVTTKQHCYLFEHRDPVNHFLSQVDAIQVAPNDKSPMWDVGYHRRLDRTKEHEALFGPYPRPETIEQKETTTVICPIYNESPATIIASMQAQTNQNWKLWLIHNGPSDGTGLLYTQAINDDRIIWEDTDRHTGNWGHATRRDYLMKVKSKYLMITNPDNYYSPVFIEQALGAIISKGRYVGAYSQQMIHNYKAWQVITCKMARGYIDCGGMLMKTKEAQDVGWKNITDHSADWLFFADLIKTYGINKFVSFNGCHFVHN